MALVVVPVRHPLSKQSRATLRRALEVAEERDADLTVLHVNLYQNDERVTRTELKVSVEEAFGRLPRTRYVVRPGFLVEETILEEIAEEGADYVVIGKQQASRFSRLLRRIVDEPDIEAYLRGELDCEVIAASP